MMHDATSPPRDRLPLLSALQVGLYEIFVHSKAVLHYSIILVLPPPSALLTLLRYYRTTTAQYTTPTRPRLCMPYTIHDWQLQYRVKANLQGRSHNDPPWTADAALHFARRHHTPAVVSQVGVFPLGHHQRCWWPSGEYALLGYNKTGVLTGETTGCDHPNCPPRTTRAGCTSPMGFEPQFC